MPKPTKRSVRRITNRQRNKATGDYCRRIAGQLAEHLNSVQIVGTMLHPDGTTSVFRYGQGDLLARMKSSEAWLNCAYGAMAMEDEDLG